MIKFYIIFALIAFLYSSVGLGGGSAYTAILAVIGKEPKYIPSTSLFLNSIVTLLGFLNYRVHVNFPDKKFFLLALYLLGVFGVLIGSKVKLEPSIFYLILGFALCLSSILSLLSEWIKNLTFKINQTYIPFASFFTGILAGITGIGGGIYLSPILLLSKIPVKEIAGITSLYIFVNSTVGFTSHFINGNVNFTLILPLSLCVVIGALLGAYLGSFKLPSRIIKLLLNTIILTIGIKLLWTGLKSI